MSSYFKYTTGNVFTLSGAEYSGVFNIDNGKAYTGYRLTSNSKQLSANRTFLAYCFLNKREFDNNATLTLTNRVSALEYSPRNLLSNQLLKKNFDILFQNNVSLFALSQTYNSSLVNTTDTVNSTSNSGVFGLTSTTIDTRNDDYRTNNDFSRAIHIDPFAGADVLRYPGLNALDDAQTSFIDTYNDGFTYTFTASSNVYTLSGEFNGELKQINVNRPDVNIIKMHIDRANEILYALTYENSIAYLNLYDYTFFRECKTYKLVDRIKATDNRIVNNNLSIGLNLKAVLVSDSTGVQRIEISPKNSARIFRVITAEELQNPEYITIALREIDDTLIIITKVVSNVDSLNVYKLSREEILDNADIGEPTEIIRAPLLEQRFKTQYSILSKSQFTVFGQNGDNVGYFFPLFVNEDAVREYTDNIQSITFPEYHGDTVFYYDPDYLFYQDADNRPSGYYIYRDAVDTVDIDVTFSEYDSNLFLLRDRDNITMRFLNNPVPIVSTLNDEDLRLPRDLIFDTEYTKFNNTNEYKFNTNTLFSNRLALKNIHVDTIGSKSYIYYHNIGRLYYFELDDRNRLIRLVDKDLICFYDSDALNKVCESSIATQLNTLIQDTLRDTINIYNNFSRIPVAVNDNGVITFKDYASRRSIEINSRDFYFHSNESVNYLSVHRVMSKLYELQQALYDRIIDPFN